MASQIADFIVPQQYLGTSTDGANFLAHVGELLDKELGKEGHHDWDRAHAAATIEAVGEILQDLPGPGRGGL
jgi:hypothetical protein